MTGPQPHPRTGVRPLPRSLDPLAGESLVGYLLVRSALTSIGANSKRLLASVWVRITHGEHILTPAIRPNVDQPRPGGPIIRHVHTRWPFISARQPTGHYIALRQRLGTFADTLTATIDDSETRW